LNIKIYGQRDDVDFPIVNIIFLVKQNSCLPSIQGGCINIFTYVRLIGNLIALTKIYYCLAMDQQFMMAEVISEDEALGTLAE
jgi:hypothetical protein